MYGLGLQRSTPIRPAIRFDENKKEKSILNCILLSGGMILDNYIVIFIFHYLLGIIKYCMYMYN